MGFDGHAVLDTLQLFDYSEFDDYLDASGVNFDSVTQKIDYNTASDEEMETAFISNLQAWEALENAKSELKDSITVSLYHNDNPVEEPQKLANGDIIKVVVMLTLALVITMIPVSIASAASEDDDWSEFEESPIIDISIDSIVVIENYDGKETESGRIVYDLESIYTAFTVKTEDGEIESDPDTGGIEYDEESYFLEIETDQSEDTIWTVGNTYSATLSIMDFTKEVPVKVVSESPIESITFQKDSAILGTEGFYSPHKQDGTKAPEPWYHYYEHNNTYTVKMKDGTVIEHTDYDSSRGFKYNGRLYNVTFDSDQDYSNQWNHPGDYTVKAYAPGYEGSYTFTVLPSPVTKVEIGEISVIEDTFTETVNIYDENYNQTGSYKQYALYDICTDYKVTLNDGTIIKGGEDYNLKYYYPIFWSDQSETNQWEAGKTYEATMEIMGVKTPFNIKIISGSNYQVEMKDTSCEMPADLLCKTDYWSSDKHLIYEFEKAIAGYEVTLPDGSVISSNPDDGHSITYKGVTYYPEFIMDEVIYDPWKVGETHTVSMKILGNKVNFQVTVVDGPVAFIDFGELKLQEKMGGEDTGDYYHYDLDELCKEYIVTLKDGTKLESGSTGNVVYQDKNFELKIYDNQEEHPWSVGDNTFDVELMGKRQTVHVTVEHRHSWMYEIKRGETCDDPRTEYYYCIREGCDATKEIPLAATGHLYEEEDGTCIYCGKLPGDIAQDVPNDDTTSDPNDDKTSDNSEVNLPESKPDSTPETSQPDAPPATGGTDAPAAGNLTTPELEEHVCVHEKIVEKATTKKSGSIMEVCTCGNMKYKLTVPKVKTVKLSKSEYVYNGKVKSPKVVVTDINGNALQKGKDYTVSLPKGRKNAGKYTYTIKFKGNYSGTKKLTLTIKPAKSVIKTTKAAKKAVTVKWQKVKKQTTGYQVILATNKKFTKNVKKVYVKGANKTSVKISKLKAKKTYYVKVRSYKTVKVNGKNTKVYSEWSSIKKCKIK